MWFLKFVDVEEFWEVAEFWEFWLVESIMSAAVAKFPSKIEGRNEWKLVEEMNTIKTRKVFDKLIYLFYKCEEKLFSKRNVKNSWEKVQITLKRRDG